MILARVVGTVVATRKDERLVSTKLLVVRPIDPSGKTEGNYLVAVDTVDAGFGETVLIVSGSSARMASGMKDCPGRRRDRRHHRSDRSERSVKSRSDSVPEPVFTAPWALGLEPWAFSLSPSAFGLWPSA